jgi:acetyl esterase
MTITRQQHLEQTMLKLKHFWIQAVFLLPLITVPTVHAQAQSYADSPYDPKPCSSESTPVPPVADDPHLAPAVRGFLVELNKSSSPFWTLPQPKPQEILTQLQGETRVDMSGVITTERSMRISGHTVQLFVMRPRHMTRRHGVILFLHGGVWIVGDFKNHERLLRDLVVESGQPAVFLQYTPVPIAKYPTQMDQAYAALEWTAAHAGELGATPGRIAVVGNSVGGDMSAALSLMDKDRKGPKISYQVLLWPATNAGVDTCSYLKYANDRFLSRAFMKYGWDIYAPTEEERANPYVSPLRATLAELHGLPPTLVITDENDVLRDEGEAYALRLQDAGVPTVATRYDGTIHDFGLLNALADLPTTRTAIREAADGIRAHIGQN